MSQSKLSEAGAGPHGWVLSACVLLLMAGAPALAAPAAKAVSSPPASVSLLLDGSQSMAGYAAGNNPAKRPLGDIIALTQEWAATHHVGLNASAFGNGDPIAITGDLDAWGTAAPYNCIGVAKCSNQESHIDAALRAMGSASPKALSILVSDLWLDTKSFSGTPAVALGGPLRAMLTDRAIAVVGVRAPFRGAVYDVPGLGTYRGASERVLIMLLAGPEADIRAFVVRLRASGSDSFAGMNFTVFSATGSVVALMPPKPMGAGFKPLAGEKSGWVIDWDDAAERTGAARGRLSASYDLEQQMPANTVWRGKFEVGFIAERLTAGQWQRYTMAKSPWRQGASRYAANFDFGPQLGALPEGQYRLTGQLIGNGITSPEPAAGWMRDWSLPANPGKPSFMTTLGLSKIADILESAVARRAVLASFTQRVDIED